MVLSPWHDGVFYVAYVILTGILAIMSRAFLIFSVSNTHSTLEGGHTKS